MINIKVALHVGSVIHLVLLLIFQVRRGFGAVPLMPCVPLTPHTVTGFIRNIHIRAGKQVSHSTSCLQRFLVYTCL